MARTELVGCLRPFGTGRRHLDHCPRCPLPFPGSGGGSAHRKSRERDGTTRLETLHPVGHEVDHRRGVGRPLHPPADHQRRARACDHSVARPEPLRTDHVEHPGLVLEVEERRPARGRGTLPVGDHPADLDALPLLDRRDPGHANAPRSSSAARRCVTGWPSGVIPVAHTSAIVSSTADMPGSAGASRPDRGAREPVVAHARPRHRACPPPPRPPPRAPPAARGRSSPARPRWPGPPGARWSGPPGAPGRPRPVKGPCVSRAADDPLAPTSSPRPRTAASPSRTATPPSLSGSRLQVGLGPAASTSGPMDRPPRGGGRRRPGSAGSRSPSAGRAAAPRRTPPGSSA